LLVLLESLLVSLEDELDEAAGALLPDEDGVLDDEDEGVLLEPAPAEPLPLMPLELGLDDEDDEAPPLAWSFFCTSTEVDDELEPDGEVLGVLGELVEPDEDDADPEGAVVAPDDGVRSEPLRLQPVTSAVPSAKVTARAIVETFMRPPWFGGTRELAANIGPAVLNLYPRSVTCFLRGAGLRRSSARRPIRCC
jgi:hypothetical protein